MGGDAPPPSTKKVPTHLHFVHNDEIWKDHVRHEFSSQLKKWPEKWGYLIREYESMNRCLEGKSPLPPISDSGTNVLETRTTQQTELKLPPIRKMPKSRPPAGFPVTTAKDIGWKSSKPDCQLEIYGRYAPKARGYLGIFKQLKWPMEGCD